MGRQILPLAANCPCRSSIEGLQIAARKTSRLPESPTRIREPVMLNQESPSKLRRLTGIRPLSMLVVAALAVLSMLTSPAAAQQSTAPVGDQGRKISLADQLRAGLKATTKSDHAFIDRVVLLVHLGKLPRRLVDSTFLWARDRAARKSATRALRPMVYFRPALTLRAKRIGVKL